MRLELFGSRKLQAIFEYQSLIASWSAWMW